MALAIGILGIAIYATRTLKRRNDRTPFVRGLAPIQIPTLLLAAPALWLLHCTYSVISDLLSTNTNRIIFPSELRARQFLTTFFFLYPTAAALALLTVVTRRPVWSGSVAVPTKDQDAASALRHSDGNRVQGL